jgi:hypothetical protein
LNTGFVVVATPPLSPPSPPRAIIEVVVEAMLPPPVEDGIYKHKKKHNLFVLEIKKRTKKERERKRREFLRPSPSFDGKDGEICV